MISNHEVKLVFDDNEQEEVPCVVTRDPEGVETFADSLILVIRMDKNCDVLNELTFDQLESLEYQILSPNFNPFGEEGDEDDE
jgi:hypothetical protein